ncbi:MAG: NAD+ synthase [Pseudohongiellaceae bacterium]
MTKKTVTIVMAQTNLLVGDIGGNTDRVLSAASEAAGQGHDVIVFPELTLTGYPPEDLLFRDSLQIRVDHAMKRIRESRLPIVIVVGLPWKEDGRLFNALAVIDGGECVAVYRKQSLPNYEVFDEPRYFTPGFSPCVVNIRGIPVGFTICEDMWDGIPLEQVSQAGAKLLININASPYHHGKGAERRALLSERARFLQMPILYVNLVGGQDELVFDGQSLAIAASGECCFEAPAFTDGAYPVEVEMSVHGVCSVRAIEGLEGGCSDLSVHAPWSLEDICYQALVRGVRDYVGKNGFRSVVLGLSGGIDSALTLAIAVDALGAERVESIMMPFEHTSGLSVELAEEQSATLGVDYRAIPIVDVYHGFMRALADEFAGLPADVTEENLQARCRGVILMAISNKKGALVLTTGNKSEIAVGYSTLYGDMAGGFNVLKDVYKTLVYRLSRYRNHLAEQRGEAEAIPVRVIERAPSAELAPGQQDSDSLPPYDRLDRILSLYIEHDYSADAIEAQGYAREEVHRVINLVDRNEYKRRQGPVGIRLTRKGFGRDRRYPITNGWRPGE